MCVCVYGGPKFLADSERKKKKGFRSGLQVLLQNLIRRWFRRLAVNQDIPSGLAAARQWKWTSVIGRGAGLLLMISSSATPIS